MTLRGFVVLAVLGVMLLAESPTAGAQQQTPAKVDELVDLINHERVAAGLLPLARSAELDQAAQAHSTDMVQYDYLDHTGSDGSQPQERANQAGYHVPPNSAWIVVEVISAISADPPGPVGWWMGDDQHRKVLMNPRWREIGAGYARGGEYGNYWTALFGCRPGVLPTVSLDGVPYAHTEECGDPAAAAALVPTMQATPTLTSPPAATRSPATATPPVATLSPASPTPPAAAAQLLPTPNVLGTGSTVSLSVNPTTAAAGSEVNVQWRGIDSPTNTDWIGLFRPGDPDTAWVTWQYVGCSQTPLDARPLGSCNLLLPQRLAAATYEVRLFSADSYRALAPPLAVRVS